VTLVGPPTVVAGGELTLESRLENRGDVDAGFVGLAMTLPSRTSPVHVEPAGNCFIAFLTVSCTFPGFPPEPRSW
jgi:hypothetical protein